MNSSTRRTVERLAMRHSPKCWLMRRPIELGLLDDRWRRNAGSEPPAGGSFCNHEGTRLRFARDSPLEGRRFEPSVPGEEEPTRRDGLFDLSSISVPRRTEEGV